MIDIINIYKNEYDLKKNVSDEDIKKDPRFLGFKDAFNNQPRDPPTLSLSMIFYSTGYTIGKMVGEDYMHDNQKSLVFL